MQSLLEHPFVCGALNAAVQLNISDGSHQLQFSKPAVTCEGFGLTLWDITCSWVLCVRLCVCLSVVF